MSCRGRRDWVRPPEGFGEPDGARFLRAVEKRLDDRPALFLFLGVLNLFKLVEERCLTFQDFAPCGL